MKKILMKLFSLEIIRLLPLIQDFTPQVTSKSIIYIYFFVNSCKFINDSHIPNL